jgi:CDP-3, 6-dideoxy-D-glycero-L-glycero-4-hexulose-4-reductase
VVFHLAAVARREHQIADITPFVQANVLFGTQLLEAMRQSGCRRLVIAGSYLQHFNTAEYRAFNLYAAMKQALEAVLAFYVDAFRLKAIRLTLSDIYSEHDTRPKLMTHIATAWATRTVLKLQGEEAWIDPIHVEDAAAACLHAARLLERDSGAEGSFVRYSVTSGHDVSATELVQLFEARGGRQILIQRGTTRNSDRTITPWRGETLPGWYPRVELQEGIARIIAQRNRS